MTRIAHFVPGLAMIGILTALAMLINLAWPLVSALLIAIVLGAVVGNVRPIPQSWKPGIAFASKKLLRFGIVLLGLQITIDAIVGLGWKRLVLVLLVVISGVAGTMVVGRALGINKRLTALIASGFSICGAAAVAGAKDTVGADEEETATALGLVVVFGTLAIPIVPAIANIAGLDTGGAATLVGASVHEVAQVVAASAALGEEALGTAVTIKLARVVCLAGVIASFSLLARRGYFTVQAGGSDELQTPRRPALVPGFVLGFLAMVILGSVVAIPQGVLDVAKVIQTASLAMAMTALGFGIQVREFVKVGFRPVALGLVATLLVTSVALAGVLIID